MPRQYTRVPLAERFWPKVDRNGPVPEHDSTLGPCWVWTASTTLHGYGQIMVTRGHPARAHIVAYRLTYGSPPSDKPLVLHHCDNRLCVRPAHLYAGTNSDNSTDAKTRGRIPSGDRHHSRTNPERVARGERHGLSKATADIVIEIRRRYAAGGVTQTDLAKEFGVHVMTVNRIVHRQSWRHIPEAHR